MGSTEVTEDLTWIRVRRYKRQGYEVYLQMPPRMKGMKNQARRMKRNTRWAKVTMPKRTTKEMAAGLLGKYSKKTI